MLKTSLLLVAATAAAASAGHAQQRGQSRDDLLDALTRHIQICAEISDSQSRLSCYDRVQTQVGNVQPQPTPLASNNPSQPGRQPPANVATPGNVPFSAAPLAPPPLTMPGGGTATLGGGLQPPTPADPDRAFDPRSSASGYRPPEGMMPKPQPAVRRSGPRPIPNFAQPQPLVSLAANNLTYGDARYWQVTIVITSNTPRTLDTQVQCTFLNAGQPVAEAYFGPTPIAAGEQISTELIGPPTTAYVDSTNCRVLRP
jgi:hypothetical protein